MTKAHQLIDLGQSIWLDYIRRAFIESGELQDVIDKGVRGVTSNPAIFEKAIAGSSDYDDALRRLANTDRSAEAIYEALAIEDIQRAADHLRPVYDATDGSDGFVSLEVSPDLAHDTEGTIAEAKRLFAAVDRPNVMIKVPATPAGIPAIEALIAQGLNINVTLMFSLDHYDAVAEAYISGLEKLVANGGDPAQAASVASFFLSRIDVAVDEKLEEKGITELQGKIAIANAKVTYQRYQETFAGGRWEALAEQGARVQRVLWASTSTKNPAYPDTMYVDNLIGPDTVNTVPPKTLSAFLDHGTAAPTVTEGLDEARAHLERLAEVGIDLDEITEALQEEGVEKFAKPFNSLMKTIEEKIEQLQSDGTLLEARLGDYQGTVDEGLNLLKQENVMARIWDQDHTVWKPEPEEITNRLGWLRMPDVMAGSLARLEALAETVREDGYEQAVLLGMGGSSLAPEVLSNVFADDHHGLRLTVLDSTHPDTVTAYAAAIDVRQTLFVVSTKSGTTVETLSFFKYFYNQVSEVVGAEAAGHHFVAITDPGSRLEKLAQDYRFRDTFLNDPEIGGRYSVLSYFGLVPAALVGVDLARLLDQAQLMARNNDSCNCPRDGNNYGGQLGAILGQLAKAGRDKVTFITSAELANFGDWVEQLIAESTGKSGVGIVPVVGEPVGDPGVYGDDRLFVHLRLDDDSSQDAALAALAEAGYPVITLHLADRYALGAQFFLWEMATAVAGHFLAIHPFNQPNVEAAKVLARQMLEDYQRKGELSAGETAALSASTLQDFLDGAEPGDYLALQAYVQPTSEAEAALQGLRLVLRDRTRLATTLGYGPRFLHSTGQLHKGDAGNGLFIQFVDEPESEVAIPDQAGSSASSSTFGVLIRAQALGDAQALRDAGRQVIRFNLGPEPVAALESLWPGLA